MRAPIPNTIGLEIVRVRGVCVMWTVRVRGVRVSVLLGAIADLAAGLRPTWLGVVDGRGSGCWLRCDTLVGCCEL